MSNNCGPFCIHFLKARLAGETFAKATGWDKAGERDIEIWKRHQPQNLWISGQTGEGLRDIWDGVRKGATRIVERIKQTIGAAENGVTRASPAVRGWLAKYGDLEIESITVCKTPVYSMIEKVGNWLSMGKLRENMDKLGYERFMHLYMIVKLTGGPTVKLEKNHLVEIKGSTNMGKEHLSVAGPFDTVGKMLSSAEKKHGQQLWQYDAVSANCQKFVLWFLDTQVTPEIRSFVEQDVAKSLEGMGYLQKAARAVTDAAAVADVAMNGEGRAMRGLGWDPIKKKVIGVV
jgi:hypothetical protein